MAPASPPPLEPAPRDRARTWLLANLLVLPGFGSILAGRRVGWAQAPLALAGFALTVLWFTFFVRDWIRLEEFPPDGGPYFRQGLVGIGVFAVAWVWALATGLSILRAARR